MKNGVAVGSAVAVGDMVVVGVASAPTGALAAPSVVAPTPTNVPSGWQVGL